MVLAVVSCDGEHHDAASTTWNLCCRNDIVVCGCIFTRRPRKKLATEILQPAVPVERQPGCFALEEERGDGWKGSGVPVIKEARPTL
jgi:hypothetical protein